ncbi:hypothetical protein [Sorangium sp. So ce887]|uniref:hypothetical protein n=1 Tax=Sorangium sp. So ce887 TaxID=3133324 RepID=UPI003F6214C0
MQNSGLLAHLVTALGAALLGAAVALRLRQPLILGYVLGGVAIGPFAPGIIGDTPASRMSSSRRTCAPSSRCARKG